MRNPTSPFLVLRSSSIYDRMTQAQQLVLQWRFIGSHPKTVEKSETRIIIRVEHRQQMKR